MSTNIARSSFRDLVHRMGIGNDKMNQIETETQRPKIQIDPPKPVEPNKSSPSATIIGSDVEIIGNIKTGGNIELHGTVQGNIEAGGKILLNGSVTGDIKAESITFTAAELKGNAATLESIVIDDGSSITGDITARNITVDGQLTGKIIIEDTCMIKENAILNGNIQTHRIGVSQGAIINGEIKTITQSK